MSVKSFLCRVLFCDTRFEWHMCKLKKKLFCLEKDMSQVKELLDKLVAENNQLKEVIPSVKKTFDTMSAALKVALDKAIDDNDLSELKNLVTEFDARSNELAASVTANTPAAEPVVDNTTTSSDAPAS